MGRITLVFYPWHEAKIFNPNTPNVSVEMCAQKGKKLSKTKALNAARYLGYEPVSEWVKCYAGLWSINLRTRAALLKEAKKVKKAIRLCERDAVLARCASLHSMLQITVLELNRNAGRISEETLTQAELCLAREGDGDE